MKPVLEFDRLTKYYGQREIVCDLSLSIEPGTIYGFLGRNGVGKTTAIRVLMGFEEPTRGAARLFGEDSRHLTPATRGRVGYLPEGHNVFNWMTIRQCGDFQRGFFEKWDADTYDAVLSHFRLEPKMKAGRLSRGQRAGLCLALTLAAGPDLLVLDDPALGLDPVARRGLLQSMLLVTRDPERTILFSSHLLADVERVADRIAIMHGSTLLADCTLEHFRQNVRRYVLAFDGTPPAPPPPEVFPGLLECYATRHELFVTVANPDATTQAKLEALKPRSLEPVEMTLEEAFISCVSDQYGTSFFSQEGGAK